MRKREPKAVKISWGWPPVSSAIVLALSAVILVVGMLWATGGMSGGGYGDGSVRTQIEALIFSVVFASWNAAPLVAGVGVALWTGRLWPGGQLAFAVGSVGIAAFTAVELQGVITSDSSTAVLEFLFLPLALWVLLGATVGATALLNHLMLRRPSSRVLPPAP